jgi:hypothetical protein
METENIQENGNGKSQGMVQSARPMVEDMSMQEEKISLFKKWWFWTIIFGAVVILMIVLFFLL